MAKESMKAREIKRAKMAAKYANKRAALKEIVRKGDPEAGGRGRVRAIGRGHPGGGLRGAAGPVPGREPADRSEGHGGTVAGPVSAPSGRPSL